MGRKNWSWRKEGIIQRYKNKRKRENGDRRDKSARGRIRIGIARLFAGERRAQLPITRPEIAGQPLIALVSISFGATLPAQLTGRTVSADGNQIESVFSSSPALSSRSIIVRIDFSVRKVDWLT